MGEHAAQTASMKVIISAALMTSKMEFAVTALHRIANKVKPVDFARLTSLGIGTSKVSTLCVPSMKVSADRLA